MALPRRIKSDLDITFYISPGSTQILWDNTDGIIDKFYLHPLEIQSAGELTYIGTSLHDLTARDTTEDADYLIRLRVMGTDDLQLDLRARRQDASNFVALKVDFLTDTIKLVETTAGVETTLDSASHDFKWNGRIKYNFELWMIGTSLHGVVNGFEIINATTTSFRTEPGISVSLPTFNSDDPAVLYSISATETEAFPSQQPLQNDPGDLLITWRQSIKEEIENPTVRTWSTYLKAVRLYEQRSAGMEESAWEQLGYPIEEPSAEEWFGNLP